MEKQVSFTSIKKEMIHDFRNKINLAENIDDLRTLFSDSIADFLMKVFEKVDITINVGDVKFNPKSNPYYKISDNLLRNLTFREIWDTSDLSDIFGDLANSLNHRHITLNKHHERTELKINKRTELKIRR